MRIKSIEVIFCTAVLALFLAGCAGQSFQKAPYDAFVLGKSTNADVAARMGKPVQSGVITKNDKQISQAIYVYAVNNPGLSAAKAQHFYYFNNVLIGSEYVSSFPDDSSDFDETKVSSIVKGVTTKSDVISLLGTPTGEFIYPLIERTDGRGLVYSYTKVTGAPFATKIYSKSLVAAYGSDGVVYDVTFTSNGTKPAP